VGCENCGTKTGTFRTIYATIGSFRAVKRGLCKECFTSKPTNSNNVCGECFNVSPQYRLLCSTCEGLVQHNCVECNRKIYENGSTCYYCQFGKGWKERESSRARVCRKCETVRYVNDEGVCHECTVLEGYKNLRHFSSVKRILTAGIPHPLLQTRQCLTCGGKFAAEVLSQVHCSKCLPRCVGCLTVFLPSNKLDRTCKSCKAKQRAHICVKCRNAERLILSPDGLCHSCIKISPTVNDCVVCGNRSDAGYCTSCATSGKDKCHCGNVKANINFECDSCTLARSRYKEYKENG